MSKRDINITCPDCGKEINVDEIIYHQLEDDIKKKYQSQISIARKEYEQKGEKLKIKSIELEQKEKEISENIENQLKEKLSIQKKEITSKIKRDIEYENAEKYKTLQSELADKSEKLKELNQTKSQVEKLKREKNELRQEIELENQKKLTEILQEQQIKIAKREADKNELKVSEKEKIINQLKEQLSEAQRKAEQGSIQLQGEIQELSIEEWLKKKFPLDEIEEIKKGQRGADSLQIIKTRTNANCGSIYYESKRTKEFQSSWIEKFRNDMREQNANIGVLVTNTMPKNMERMGLIEGVWVCTYQEFKGLCWVLRENIITLSNAIASQENKGDKMVMLYNFLTSNEFKLQIEAIVEGFTQMQTDLEREKRSIQGHWKKREKQINKVLLNTNYMYSSIKGIAGNAIQTIPQLELPKTENDNSEE
ncbi:DUF2130 domain-containing protein [uncultured Aquimarina sp.]|uniref:DUF2130 domain-containing protein n=1 Tax=uncultured Aquimarina sp. TaxID=575652 RepID=UPI00262C91D0|nr:DUF2130 domain-containing protein [uncultured Aquimarina sp.]